MKSSEILKEIKVMETRLAEFKKESGSLRTKELNSLLVTLEKNKDALNALGEVCCGEVYCDDFDCGSYGCIKARIVYFGGFMRRTGY